MREPAKTAANRGDRSAHFKIMNGWRLFFCRRGRGRHETIGRNLRRADHTLAQVINEIVRGCAIAFAGASKAQQIALRELAERPFQIRLRP